MSCDFLTEKEAIDARKELLDKGYTPSEVGYSGNWGLWGFVVDSLRKLDIPKGVRMTQDDRRALI